MGNDGERERERLREIGVRAFRQVFDEPTVEQALEVLGEYRDRPGVAGFQWGHTVGYDAGVTLVLWNAIRWKFDRQVADAVSSLFADILDTGCVLDVMAVLVKVDRPYDLRDAALARLARAMARPEVVPEPIPQLRKAFRDAQHAAETGSALAGVPTEGILPEPFPGAFQGWIRGILEGHHDGMHDALGRIIHERFGEWMALAASVVLDERIGQVKAGVLPPYGVPGAGGSMKITRRQAPAPLVLEVHPTRGRETDHRSWEVGAIVLLVDPASRPRIDPGLSAKILGLSPMETRVAVALAEGHTAAEIAQALGSAESTVRTHVRRIYRKLEISRQTELVGRILSLEGLRDSFA